MVLRKNLKKFALISVFEKKNLKYLCSNLNKFNYSFISSGSTGNQIRELGFKLSKLFFENVLFINYRRNFSQKNYKNFARNNSFFAKKNKIQDCVIKFFLTKKIFIDLILNKICD